MPNIHVQSDFPSLAVDERQTVILTTNRPEATGFRVARMRPRTTAALMLLGGMRLSRPPRLSDPNAFEEVSDTQDLVDLRVVDSSGRVGNHSIRFIKSVVSRLDPDQPIPATLSFEAPRKPKPVLQTLDASLGKQRASLSDDQGKAEHVASTVTLPVPGFISSLNLVFVGLKFTNIFLGPDATLIIDEDVTHLQVINFIAYSTAKVIQKTPYLLVDIMGTMVGDTVFTATPPKTTELVAKLPPKLIKPPELLTIGIKPKGTFGL